MEEETNLKKLGLKHLRKAEGLEKLIKAGLRSIDFKGGKVIANVEYRYKHGIVSERYAADTFCEAIDKALAVHGEE